MCGRYVLKTPVPELQELLGFENAPPHRPRYNIAPRQDVLVVRAGGQAPPVGRASRPDPPDDRRRWAELMRWGLIPSWADDPQVGARLINARAETVADKPAFRGPFRRSRCVIPADGFYEWHGDAGGRKQPYYIRRADGRALVFAGLWDEWSPPDGEPVRTCIIITVDAAAAVAQLHPRMPAMISPQQAEPWLDLSAEPERLGAVLGAPEAGELTFHAVSAKVNSPVHDAPDCIEPAESDRPRQGRLF